MPGKRTVVYAVLAAALAGLAALAVTQWVLPRVFYASHTTLSLLSGETLALKYRETEYLHAKDGWGLGAGDRVRTQEDSRAVITFFEGSTITLEPETEVLITSLLQAPASQNAATAVGVHQAWGTTWSRVQHLGIPASRYQIETPAGLVTVRGSLVRVDVEQETGRTRVRSDEGVLTVRGQGMEIELPPATRTSMQPGRAPEPPEPAPPAAERLVFTMTGRIWLRVVDSAGRTAGFVSPGLQVNQVLGAFVSLPFAAPTTITLPVEASGEYDVVLEGVVEGDYQFALQGVSGSTQLFVKAWEGTIRPEHRFRAKLEVTVEGGRLTDGRLSNFVPIRDGEGPGQFVRTRTGVNGAAQTATAVVEQGTPTPILTRTPTVTRTPNLTPSPTATGTPTPGPVGTGTPAR